MSLFLAWVSALLTSMGTVQAEPSETLVRLTVTPMPAPKPALRYHLLPELNEMSPGNPIQGYLRCFFDQDLNSERETLNKSALRMADRAARLDKPDWQLLPHLRKEGINLLLPDLQKMRALASGLQERMRTEIAQGRFDDAIITAQTILALSRHMGEHPTLIGDLVAMAIAQVGLAPLEEMLGEPNCPNLYWALTNLPNPLISLEKGLEGERIITQAELRDLDDVNPMSAAQLKKLMAHIDNLRDFGERKEKSTQAWVNERTKDSTAMNAARKRLVEYGMPVERLESFPAEQVVLLDEKRELEERRDNVTKLMNLPTWQAHELGSKLPRPNLETTLLGNALYSAYQKIRIAQGRLEHRIALLRHVEAIRLYAAEHGGKLPEKLADVTVPLPVDPYTGKPFRYVLEGSTAHLRGTPPSGMEKIATYNLHYEITVRK